MLGKHFVASKLANGSDAQPLAGTGYTGEREITKRVEDKSEESFSPSGELLL